jgi:hypothetical protein
MFKTYNMAFYYTDSFFPHVLTADQHTIRISIPIIFSILNFNVFLILNDNFYTLF